MTRAFTLANYGWTSVISVPTRAELAQMAADGRLIDGRFYQVGDVMFLAKAVASVFDDIPGAVPALLWTPIHWGATGDGTGNDGPAINNALAAFKAAVEGAQNRQSAAVFSGMGRTYRTTVSLNATGITGWGWEICDMQIVGACTGKAVFNLIGTRGGKVSRINGYGDPNNMPSVGIQLARSGTGEEAFASSSVMEKCVWQGFYSVGAFHGYGYEAWAFRSCKFWNSNPNARAFIGLGYDKVPMASDYLEPISGFTSFILNQYDDLNVRYLPTVAASVASISRAANAVVTTTSPHPFTTGQRLTLSQLGGVAQGINSRNAICTVIDSTSFSLAGIDTTGMASDYVGGGLVALAATVAPMLIGRASQHTFTNLYVVAYGTPAIDWTFSHTTSSTDDQNELNVLVEGAPTHLVNLIDVDADKQMRGFKFRTYNAMPDISIFTSNAPLPFLTRLRNAQIEVQNWAYGNKPLFSGTAANVSLLGADVYVPNLTDFDSTPGVMVANFVGQHYAADAGTVRHRGARMESPDLRSPTLHTPTIWESGVQRWSFGANGTLIPATNLLSNIGALAARVGNFAGNTLNLGTTDANGLTVTHVTGSPEGVVTALQGSFALRRDGALLSTVYFKASGSGPTGGNTGWVAMQPALVGTTAQRPTSGLSAGVAYFDTTLGRPIWRNAGNTGWVDAAGTAV